MIDFRNKPPLFSTFEQTEAGVATNYLLAFLREGKNSTGEFHLWLEAKVDGENVNPTLTKLYHKVRTCEIKIVQDAIDFYIAWEALSFADKKSWREDAKSFYIKRSQKGQPVTDKQTEWLKKKNYTGTPPKDRAEASEILDKLFKK